MDDLVAWYRGKRAKKTEWKDDSGNGYHLKLVNRDKSIHISGCVVTFESGSSMYNSDIPFEEKNNRFENVMGIENDFTLVLVKNTSQPIFNNFYIKLSSRLGENALSETNGEYLVFYTHPDDGYINEKIIMPATGRHLIDFFCHRHKNRGYGDWSMCSWVREGANFYGYSNDKRTQTKEGTPGPLWFPPGKKILFFLNDPQHGNSNQYAEVILLNKALNDDEIKEIYELMIRKYPFLNEKNSNV